MIVANLLRFAANSLAGGRHRIVARSRASLLVAALSALAGAAAPAFGEQAGQTHQIEIRNFAFAPNDITVPAGTRIVWTNHDDEPHTLVSASGAFKPSQALDTNDSFATVLDKPGTYRYFCGIHPMMVGKIVVR
ncbi:cupredoxin family copper-binding protein [Trinickia sp. LjRoot230]|uniref:cupredoxin domain-containing protein n=1 Tax=Trinickia sp. LjRoot230 TaxID=3342288 RepID=UPI003ED024BD